MTLVFHVARASGPTGRLIESTTRAALGGHVRPGPAHVCYGAGGNYGPRTLNAKAGALTKWQELEALQVDRVPVPDFKQRLDASDFENGRVWLARKLDHRGGTDIRPVLQPEEAEWRRAAGWDFFTRYLTVTRELRTWVFRDKHLGTYEKHMVRPNEYTRYGRGNKQGFQFRLVPGETVPREWKDTARKAVSAIGLDFGAVDMVCYRATPGEGAVVSGLAVLEVNSAPGAASGARQCVQLLSRHIAQWYLAPASSEREVG